MPIQIILWSEKEKKNTLHSEKSLQILKRDTLNHFKAYSDALHNGKL